MGGGLRYFGGAVAFGFAAVWIMWSLAAALICLLAAVAGYGAGLAAERARAKLITRTSNRGSSTPKTPSRPRPTGADDLSQKADELNHDLGHLYEPPAATPPLADGADASSLHDEGSSDRELR